MLIALAITRLAPKFARKDPSPEFRVSKVWGWGGAEDGFCVLADEGEIDALFWGLCGVEGGLVGSRFVLGFGAKGWEGGRGERRGG